MLFVVEVGGGNGQDRWETLACPHGELQGRSLEAGAAFSTDNDARGDSHGKEQEVAVGHSVEHVIEEARWDHIRTAIGVRLRTLDWHFGHREGVAEGDLSVFISEGPVPDEEKHLDIRVALAVLAIDFPLAGPPDFQWIVKPDVDRAGLVDGLRFRVTAGIEHDFWCDGDSKSKEVAARSGQERIAEEFRRDHGGFATLEGCRGRDRSAVGIR